MPVLLEVCVDSPVGLNAAIAGGADRIELCSSLAVGGLTPSPGFMALAAKSGRPARAMIRPRVGDYVYSEAEIDVMRGDIDAARAAGLAGVVIGASLPNWHLDEKTITRLAEHAKGLELTLNRTVDMSPDPLAAVDMVAALGFRSILTSGGSLKAPDGIQTIAAMVARAGTRVEILAGSGLNPGNVRMMVEKTHVREVHGSFAAPWPDIDEKLVRFGYIAPDARETSEAAVRQAKAALAAL
ncbi:MAG: copper homeostasis protein CutC [Proteobacteria bacterium]|nr:copper homeostasis protein CutC [Pseudomonadota bacterium]